MKKYYVLNKTRPIGFGRYMIIDTFIHKFHSRRSNLTLNNAVVFPLQEVGLVSSHMILCVT